MALQKSGAPQGSYMLSIVADNPNQTMYLASADNAAKLSQEELSAIASEKMVPLLNQQKNPEAVIAYLDALSAKAQEMGSGLAVAPWAMIAFLVALIVVIIVISRVLRARRKAQNRTEDNASGESTEALASQDLRSQLPAFAVGTRQGGVTESEASTSKESSKTAVVDEDDHEDEQPSKGKFRLRFGRNDKSSGKSKSGKTPVDNPDTAKAVSENFADAASSQPAAAALLQTPSTDAGLVNKEPNLTSVAGTAQVKAEEPNPAIPTGVPGTLNTSSSGIVPSLADLDLIALARTRFLPHPKCKHPLPRNYRLKAKSRRSRKRPHQLRHYLGNNQRCPRRQRRCSQYNRGLQPRKHDREHLLPSQPVCRLRLPHRSARLLPARTRLIPR